MIYKITRYSVIFFVFMFVCSACNILMAQETEVILKSYTLYFKINETKVNKEFKNNEETIIQLIDDMSRSSSSDSLEVKSISIMASASPDGTLSVNRYIARLRALNTIQLLENLFPHLDHNIVVADSKTNMWENLLYLIADDPSVKYKDEMCAILNNTSLSYSEKYNAFRSNPDLYRYVKSNFLDRLRIAQIEIILSVIPVSATEKVAEKEHVLLKNEVGHVNVHFVQKLESNFNKVEIPLPYQRQTVLSKCGYKPVLAIKTNMLYDISLVPNLGVEFYLSDEVSFAGNWMYSWWNKDSKNYTWRIYGGDVALRRWFGNNFSDKRFTGHHLGIYGQMMTFDFNLGKRGFMGEKWTFGAGVEYGYSFPVSNKLNIDLNLGLGYLKGEVKEYLPEDDHYVWQRTADRQLIGPTKAEVSLVWLLGYKK